MQAPSSSFTLKYDAWNRLVEVKDGTVVQANEYDGLNRRIVRDESGGSGVLKHFYYNNQWQVLVEADPNNNPTAMYSYHPQYVDAVAVRMRDADAHIYLQDANFNVTAMMDSAGTVVERYSYTPYGEVTVLDADFSVDPNGTDIANELLYTGRRRDPETGLQLNRNRFYHAPLGRWVNRDPSGYGGGARRIPSRLSDVPLRALRQLKNAPNEVRSLIPRFDEVIARAAIIESQARVGAKIGSVKVTPGYQDRMSLYAAYFVPNHLDPTGETVFCGAVGDFVGWGIGGSGALMYCEDDCEGDDSTWMICLGVGFVVGGGGALEGFAGEGCVSDGFSGQGHFQGSLGPVSGGITVGPGGAGGINTGGEIGGGVGAGCAATFERCYAW